jgi:ribosomal protein S4
MKTLVKTMAENNIVRSCSEGRRLILQGAIKLNGVLVDNISEEVKGDEEIQIGKREMIRLDEEPVSKTGAV